MEVSMRKINALFQKEVKGLSKNKNVLIMCLLPILFAVMYSQLFLQPGAEEGMRKLDILTLCLSMNLLMVPIMVIGMLIAEEKEKNTLRTLMLSGITPMEFLTGKLLLTVIITVASNLIIFLILGFDMKYLGIYILLTSLVMISMIMMGAILGMISPNQMSTGVMGVPMMLIFMIIPVFGSFNETLRKIAVYLPNYNLNILLSRAFGGDIIGKESLSKLAVILVWIIISAVIAVITYRKVGIDK